MQCLFPLQQYLSFLVVLTTIFHASHSLTTPTHSRRFTPSVPHDSQSKATINARSPASLSLGSRTLQKRTLQGSYTVGSPTALWDVALAASYPFIPTMEAAHNLETLYSIAMAQTRGFISSGAETWNAFGFKEGAVSLVFRVLNDDNFGVPWQLVIDLAESFLERARMGHVGIFTGRVTGGGKVIEVVLDITQSLLDRASEIHGG